MRSTALPGHDHLDRIGRLQEAMTHQGFAACVVTLPENIYYLCGHDSAGYERFRALVVPASGTAILVLPAWEAVNEPPPGARYLPYGLNQNPCIPLCATISEMVPSTKSTVGLEQRHYFLSVQMYRELSARLPHIDWFNAFGLVEEARLIKSAVELAAVEQAGRAAVAGLEAALAHAAVGRTENDIAAMVYRGTILAGSEYPGSPPYVTCGERTGLPHATWEGATLQPGDLLLLEHSASIHRYHAAVMRTACLGQPTADQLEAHRAVAGALCSAIAAIRPGVPAAEVDAVCREELLKAGWKRMHNTGYSIGLAYPPGWNEAYLFALNPRNTRPLAPGMTLYLIPSVHLHQRYTIGCGDTVRVTAEGCEVLTPYPRTLLALNPEEAHALPHRGEDQG